MVNFKIKLKNNLKKTILSILFVLYGLSISCSNKPPINEEGPYWKDDDMKGIKEPQFDEPPILWYTFKRSTLDQATELFDIDRNIRKISGNPTQAKNTNCLDEVPNSSWFTNRHGYPSTKMTSEQIFAGPSITTGPDTSEIWNVFRLKSGGATLGFLD